MHSAQKALTLLAAMRQTPMLRGGRISERRLQLMEDITSAIAAQGALPRLAKRVAFQFSLKFEETDLGDQTVWRAVGDRLHHDSAHLRTKVGLVDRQIIVALPKLSAEQVEDLLKKLTARDAAIARTILNVALDGADPPAAADRYLKEYHRVAKQFESIDPGIARTVANATFMASTPRAKAEQYFTHFSALVARFDDDVEFARTIARVAFRSSDPIRTANDFVATHDAIVAQLTSESAEPQIARTLAAIASLGADPMPTARRLLRNFNQIVRAVRRTHPSIARSIALSACRAADPLTMARSYTKNYDAIVRMVNRIDPQCAREVASQAFRSDNPLLWAKRYLEELHRTRSQAHVR